MDDALRRRSVGPPAARSVLLTLLGEFVLPTPKGVWQETLIHALGALEYKTQAARQALARRRALDQPACRARGTAPRHGGRRIRRRAADLPRGDGCDRRARAGDRGG